MKKKIKFKKKIIILKISRFNKYIQRAVEKDLLKIRKPDSHIAILPNSIPVTILRLEIKKAAASILSKNIYFNLFINSNRRILAKAYIIIPRRLKDEIKVGLNIKKLLTIIMSTQMKDVTVKNLITNYPHVYKTFFEKAIPKNRKKKKNSVIMNSIRTGVNAKIVFFSREPDCLPNFI
jgi:hypothetical protein